MKRVIVAAAVVLGFCVAYVLAHLALIEIGSAKKIGRISDWAL